MIDRLKDVNDALDRVRNESGAECLRLLEFYKISGEGSCELFANVLKVSAGVTISGPEIDLQDRLPEIVKLRAIHSLHDMIELLKIDIEKLQNPMRVVKGSKKRKTNSCYLDADY
jgi:hypothetical protein